MKNNNYICTAAIGSVTQALQAQNALAAAMIPSEVIKIEKTNSRRGCIYGISFSCFQENNVRAILRASKIQVRSWENSR